MKLKNQVSLVTIILIALFSIVSPAEERWPARLTMDDLTDPTSPSYVPYPYPDTRQKIIANLKYQVSKRFGKNSWRKEIGKSINLIAELIKEKPGAVVGEIVKVKNRLPYMPESYSYLIIISDLKGKHISRAAMKANGLLSGWTDPSTKQPGIKLKKFDHVIEKMNRHFKRGDLKTIERIAYGLVFADVTHPIYEITLKDGSKYFYDHRGKAYKKEKEKVYKGKLRTPEASAFYLSEKKKVKKDEFYLYDMIDQKFIVLKKLK